MNTNKDNINNTNNIVGKILGLTLRIEHQLNKLIANYFCKDAVLANSFIKNILGNSNFSFDFKISVVKKFMLIEDKNNFYANLRKIQEIRNQVAHWYQNHSEEGSVIVKGDKSKPIEQVYAKFRERYENVRDILNI